MSIGFTIFDLQTKRYVAKIGRLLKNPGTNNKAEFSALYTSLLMALKMGYNDFDIYGDNQLVINSIGPANYKISSTNIREKYNVYVQTFGTDIQLLVLRKISERF